jgi:hypothetical protein
VARLLPTSISKAMAVLNTGPRSVGFRCILNYRCLEFHGDRRNRRHVAPAIVKYGILDLPAHDPDAVRRVTPINAGGDPARVVAHLDDRPTGDRVQCHPHLHGFTSLIVKTKAGSSGTDRLMQIAELQTRLGKNYHRYLSV